MNQDDLSTRCLRLVALPMAHTSGVEGRLKAILRKNRRQEVMTRRGLMVTVAISAGLLVPLAALQPVAAVNALEVASSELRGEIVVIDAGHGAQDTGTVVAGGVTEKALNLEIAQRLRSLLEQRGAVVYMTRDEDTYLDVRERPQFAAKKHADFLISIHCEGEKPTGRSGGEVYYHADDKLEHRLAETINVRVGQVTRFPGRVLSDSTRFRSGFGVLRGASMPAVLVMCGFMGSAQDLVRLRDPQGQQQIAEGIAQGLTTFRSRP